MLQKESTTYKSSRKIWILVFCRFALCHKQSLQLIRGFKVGERNSKGHKNRHEGDQTKISCLVLSVGFRILLD